MSTMQHRHHPDRAPRRVRPRPLVIAAAVLAAAVLLATAVVVTGRAGVLATAADRGTSVADGTAQARVTLAPAGVLPGHGQSAYSTGATDEIMGDPDAAAVPIASVAKVMTAFVVLREQPMQPWESGRTLVLDAGDVADTERRRAEDQSVVDVAAGERLTTRDALRALLLPSANNIAAVLATEVSGSEQAFVDEMNATAAMLGMDRTHYTDPSGFAETTVSTATDQVRLMSAALQDPTFAAILAERSATIPVAGTVHTTDDLVGRDGFLGGKTGSHDAAGGCFVFRATRPGPGGTPRTVTGAVLGQRGDGSYTDAAFTAAQQLVGAVVTRG